MSASELPECIPLKARTSADMLAQRGEHPLMSTRTGARDLPSWCAVALDRQATSGLGMPQIAASICVPVVVVYRWRQRIGGDEHSRRAAVRPPPSGRAGFPRPVGTKVVVT